MDLGAHFLFNINIKATSVSYVDLLLHFKYVAPQGHMHDRQ